MVKRSFRALLAFLLLFVFVSLVAAQDNPVADPKAVVTDGTARFTILTPQIIRMEWTANRQFEDHASLVFINRRTPVPQFTTGSDGDWLTIRTDKLLLRYRKNSGRFTPENLTVELQLNGRSIVWRPGTPDKGNLQGTIRTLDGVKGSAKLGEGLVSRDGWVLIDDTNSNLFDNSDWPWVMPRPQGEKQDWYFFGHGHDYKQALKEYTEIAGKIPLPPRFAFGTWWSRYWSYTDEEFKQLVREFEEHNVPLDVLVIDMDWHLTFGNRWWENRKDQSGHSLGWTGYTWNRDLFPDPPGFLKWTEEHGLKATMNLHPASGVQPHEEAYPEMARAMGSDPATKQYVPFDIANKKFAINYLNILHHPLEKQGVKFWWLDWQQEHNTTLAGLNPTWWLNYVHFTDMERRGIRPLIFHRWGGLGNHRYQIGFSGDTVSVWDSLAFQPYFTATAANVGYGYWSHDIGGHMPGAVSPELYTRWIQWGVFSPILRTHTTKNPDSERRIWAYPVEYAETMRKAFVQRYALIPYIYTMGREAYDTGISLLRPMYYDYPEAPDAYDFKDQYMFGDSMLVAPVITPADTKTGLAGKNVWLPQGTWIESDTGAIIQGPTRVDHSFAIDQVPVYVKAGAIIPMQPEMQHTGAKPVDPLILNFYPRANGNTRVYEDEGNTLGYKKTEFAWTKVEKQLRKDEIYISIDPVEGMFPGMLTERRYELRLLQTLPPQSVTFNGEAVPYSAEQVHPPAPSWHYDGDHVTTVILLPKTSVTQKIELHVRGSEDPQLTNGVQGQLAALHRAYDILNHSWPKGWSPDSLIVASQTGNRIGNRPEAATAELQKLKSNLPAVLKDIQSMDIDRATIDRAVAQFGPAH